MTVSRTEDQEGPALMTVHFATPQDATTTLPEITSSADKNASTGPPTTAEAGPTTIRVETINMKHRVDSEIVGELLKLTNARVVKPKPEELREIAELERLNAEAEQDQADQEKIYARQRRERAMLKAAQAAPGEMVST
jgi:large subunit ribosomal protein MRP49